MRFSPLCVHNGLAQLPDALPPSLQTRAARKEATGIASIGQRFAKAIVALEQVQVSLQQGFHHGLAEPQVAVLAVHLLLAAAQPGEQLEAQRRHILQSSFLGQNQLLRDKQIHTPRTRDVENIPTYQYIFE